MLDLGETALRILPLTASALSLVFAFFTYRYVATYQSRVSTLSYLKQLEVDAMNLLNKHYGRVEQEGTIVKFRYRNMLNEVVWRNDFTNETVYDLHSFMRDVQIGSSGAYEGDNFVSIRADGARLSSAALNETLVWFRQARRAFKLRAVDRDDLSILWRVVLPFTQSGRYGFFRRYFGTNDFKQIAEVCQMVFASVYEQRSGLPKTIIDALDEEFLADFGVSRSNLKDDKGTNKSEGL